MKNLPAIPAGIAVNAQAIQTDAAQTVPEGLPLEAEFSADWDMKTLAPAIETGASMTLRPGIGVPAEGALPTSQPGTFSVLSNQGDALGVSPAARQVAQLATPFAHAQWQSDLGEKVVWLAGRQGQMAELSLNPPSLGGIEVRLNLSGQEAGAHFFSANPAVREAIEAALPRLREMMAEAGLSLGQTTVSSEPFRDREAHAQTAQTGSGEDETTGDFLPAGEAIWRQGHPGRVDLYV
jgi:flagellar hook-length control protein FliK